MVHKGTSYNFIQIFLFRVLKLFVFSWLISLELFIAVLTFSIFVFAGYGVLSSLLPAIVLYMYLSQPPSLPPGEFGPRKVTKNVTSPPAPLRGDLIANTNQFVDRRTKRVAFLRGINLGGGCKLPTLPSPQFLYDSKTSQLSLNVSFVGRPIPLDTLSSHLARIRAYGFTILRLLVTWEAVEPIRPGVYDLEFLKYFRQVVMECHRHSISVFVDPHQDVWSRFTGGSVRYVRAHVSVMKTKLTYTLSHTGRPSLDT